MCLSCCFDSILDFCCSGRKTRHCFLFSLCKSGRFQLWAKSTLEVDLTLWNLKELGCSVLQPGMLPYVCLSMECWLQLFITGWKNGRGAAISLAARGSFSSSPWVEIPVLLPDLFFQWWLLVSCKRGMLQNFLLRFPINISCCWHHQEITERPAMVIVLHKEKCHSSKVNF